jgi:hypothetical protein
VWRSCVIGIELGNLALILYYRFGASNLKINCQWIERPQDIIYSLLIQTFSNMRLIISNSNEEERKSKGMGIHIFKVVNDIRFVDYN